MTAKNPQARTGPVCPFLRDSARRILASLIADCAEMRGKSFGNWARSGFGRFGVLNTLFANMLSRAKAAQTVDGMDRWLRIGFKAQSQCRTTLEALGQLKMPPVFAKQANISSGPQQVNNGQVLNAAPPRAQLSESTPNRLLEASTHERVDGGAENQATGSDSDVEAVAVVNRAANASRQDARGWKRFQGRNPSEIARLRPRAKSVTRRSAPPAR